MSRRTSLTNITYQQATDDICINKGKGKILRLSNIIWSDIFKAVAKHGINKMGGLPFSPL